MEHALKALGEGRVAGYLVYFGSPEARDLHGEYFTPETEYHLDWYDRRPALYHHGLDKTVKAQPVGLITSVTKNDVGLWAEAQLAMHNEYAQSVYEMVEKGALGWSSGSIPHIVKVDNDGRILEWPIVEGSLTPTPAEPRGTWITAKHYSEPTELATAYKSPALDVSRFIPADAETAKEAAPIEPTPASAVIDNSPTTQETKMDLQQMVSDILNPLAQAAPISVPPEELAAMAQQLVTEMTPAASAPEAAANPAPVLAAVASKAAVMLKEHTDKIAAAKAAYEALVNSAVEAAKAAAPATQQAPAFTGGIALLNGNAQKARVENVQDRRFDHLNAAEMALGHQILSKLGKPVSEDYLKAMAYKTAQQVERGDAAANDLAVKSQLPAIKANEVMQVDLANFGSQYAVTYFSTDVWETVRQATNVYDRMSALGMDVKEVPDGNKSETIPLEGADMVFYNAAGAADTDTSSHDLTPTYSSSRIGTGNKEVTLARLSARTYWQQELDQDSIVNLLQEANRKVRVVGAETLENVIINGDTVMTANTNLNLIDGTPAAAPNKPAYTLFDGLAKLPIITNTANLYNAANTLTEAVYLNLMPLLGTDGRFAADPDKIMYIIDNSTYFASLNLAVLRTEDVFPSATIVEGVLCRIWGVEVLRSAQFGRAQAAGTVSATPGNNTLGRILLVRPDQWAFRWKRQLEIYTDFDPKSYTTWFTAHMRCGMAFRDNEAAAAARNVNVTIA